MNQALFQQIRECLMTRWNPSFIIVFGSFAKGINRADSDIDIAFFCNNDDSPTSYEKFIVAQELASFLQMDVDLVNIKEVSTVFKAQIFSSGQLIYAQDEELYKEQRMIALSMYAKLNEERKIVLDKIDESGSIYEK
ncbi:MULTISPECIES: type VII toxin-antitoxin system MntA family adenylyltransferase antitoxin [Cytobacillus]|uniref:DNA polymerase subunit beta n=1 Tax=Cytobacillus kochii TaxID=859143 RepID=A0A248TPT9_9BACI|nr:nucleotidyltransferase domain-containing protein [Cytobacillus kochii]ASV70139.1 DNA polymerase subunit beta [Cytobacillus kochii]MDQ0186703.1 putative nucleotidyltransferase [Cytobacillus kochii]